MWKFSIFIVLLTGCTVHQEARIREVLTTQQGPFPRIQDITIVQESLGCCSREFDLLLESSNPLSTPKGTFPLWILKGEKIPLEERFIFAVIDKITGSIDPQYEFEVLEDGRLKIFDRRGVRIESEIPFVETRPFPTGSPIQYAIVSKENYTSAVAEFTPYPIETTGASSEHLNIEVTHPMGTHLSLSATHFSPNEKVLLIHTSGDRTETVELLADDQGSFATDLNPTVFGKLGGEATVTIIGKMGEVGLSYPWGSRLEKRAFVERSCFPILFVANRLPEELNQKEIENHFTATFFHY